MKNSPATSGQVIDIAPLGDALGQAKTMPVFKSDHVDVIRMVLPAGKKIAEHTAKGPITVQCLEGVVEFSVSGQPVELREGRMLCLSMREPHALHALQDSSLLITLLRAPASQYPESPGAVTTHAR